MARRWRSGATTSTRPPRSATHCTMAARSTRPSTPPRRVSRDTAVATRKPPGGTHRTAATRHGRLSSGRARTLAASAF
eukprot:153539-Chlamydomonas_euryale.AAC.1